MDCPPDKENLKSYILVTEKLHNAKVNVPKLFDCDQENGFLVLSDLGDDLYSKNLITKQFIAYTLMRLKQLLKCKPTWIVLIYSLLMNCIKRK